MTQAIHMDRRLWERGVMQREVPLLPSNPEATPHSEPMEVGTTTVRKGRGDDDEKGDFASTAAIQDNGESTVLPVLLFPRCRETPKSGFCGLWVIAELDSELVAKCKLETVRLETPINIMAIDKTPLAKNVVKFVSKEFILKVGSCHQERITCFVLDNLPAGLVLGFPWLLVHNPVIDWEARNIVKWGPNCSKKCLISVSVSSVSPERIPEYLKDFEDVFSKKEAEVLLPHRPFDCAVDLVPGAKLPKAHLYNLSGPERAAMKEYISDSLHKGHIQPSLSGGESPSHPPPVLVDRQTGYEVARVVDSRMLHRSLQYLVHWKGYGLEDWLWVPARFVHVDRLVRAFHARYPVFGVCLSSFLCSLLGLSFFLSLQSFQSFGVCLSHLSLQSFGVCLSHLSLQSFGVCLFSFLCSLLGSVSPPFLQSFQLSLQSFGVCLSTFLCSLLGSVSPPFSAVFCGLGFQRPKITSKCRVTHPTIQDKLGERMRGGFAHVCGFMKFWLNIQHLWAFSDKNRIWAITTRCGSQSGRSHLGNIQVESYLSPRHGLRRGTERQTGDEGFGGISVRYRYTKRFTNDVTALLYGWPALTQCREADAGGRDRHQNCIAHWEIERVFSGMSRGRCSLAKDSRARGREHPLTPFLHTHPHEDGPMVPRAEKGGTVEDGGHPPRSIRVERGVPSTPPRAGATPSTVTAQARAHDMSCAPSSAAGHGDSTLSPRATGHLQNTATTGAGGVK
ncbi:unnamed protein product, partial [Ranitomeya imitator]